MSSQEIIARYISEELAKRGYTAENIFDAGDNWNDWIERQEALAKIMLLMSEEEKNPCDICLNRGFCPPDEVKKVIKCNKY